MLQLRAWLQASCVLYEERNVVVSREGRIIVCVCVCAQQMHAAGLQSRMAGISDHLGCMCDVCDAMCVHTSRSIWFRGPPDLKSASTDT
jgi:hypothetical protein